MKLKILLVSHDLNIGGLQRVVLDLAHALRKLGHDAHVCSLRGPGPLKREADALGVPVHAMPWPENGVDRWMMLKVARLLKRERFHVIHTHNTQAFIDGGLGAVLARTPVRVHTDHARGYPDRWKYLFAEKVLSFAYDKVVAVSDHTLRDLRRYQGIPASRLMVIPNGINVSLFRAAHGAVDRAELRMRAGLDRFTKVFGLGVRLEDQKGIKFLVAAMPEIVREFPAAGLAVAGGGSLMESLKAQAKDLGVEKNVVFLGPTTDMARFYPMLDFFILPSLWEGMPLCILEAMSVKLPVIATRVGGVPEMINDGKDGLLIDPEKPEQISAAVRSLLRDPARAAELGAEACRRFDSRFDFTQMAKDYLDLFQARAERAGIR